MKTWSESFEFSVAVAAVHLAAFLTVARFGGPMLGTEFDATEIRCAFAGCALALPLVMIGTRFHRR